MKNFLISLLLISFAMSGSAQVKNGMAAPELSLPDAKGQILRLSDLKGKVVLIDFWASWCTPCRKNNPHLVALYRKLHGKGFEIFGVSIDEDPADWQEAIAKDKIDWPQVNDHLGWRAVSAQTYGVEAIPASYLIDRQGIIRKIDLTGRKLELEIESLLKQ